MTQPSSRSCGRPRAPRSDPGLEAAFAVIVPDRLAPLLGVSPQAISSWVRVPATRCLEVAKLTGVPLHVLRPDVYPAPGDSISADMSLHHA